MSKLSNTLIMLKLLSSKRKYTIKELAEILEVTPRMIRNYKDDLEKSGIYIDSIKGPYGGYVLNHETDLDKKLIKILQAQNKKLIILKGIYEDEIVNNFYLTLLSIYLMQNIAINKNINLSRIDYDKYVIPKIYRFKGSM